VGIPVEFCEPWTTPDKLCCPDVVGVDCVSGEPDPATYAWTDEELIEAATSLLFKQTCHLFPGHCQITVRPCAYCSCNRNKCGCGRYVFIDLQDRYPIISVDEVLVDGVVVPPAAYRVDDYRRLVRVDGACWPTCNDLSLDDSQPRTFSVQYTAGRRPPIELQMAAAELACELKRACTGNDCRLPANVTQVNRQGVTLNIDALEAAVNGGVSGIAIVDAAIQRYNCARAKARVWHPSLRTPRQVFPS
jgi:hypothetical protein